jgi:hypothetical protein
MTELRPGKFAIEVPEGVKVRVNNVHSVIQWEEKESPHYWDTKPLPPGTWKLLFLTSEATEEDCDKVVGDTTFMDRYFRYAPDGTMRLSKMGTCDTAKESFQSLLENLGLKQNYAILKKEK